MMARITGVTPFSVSYPEPNDNDNTRKHLLRLFGIAGISDCEGSCCDGKKQNSEASHGTGFLICNRAGI